MTSSDGWAAFRTNLYTFDCLGGEDKEMVWIEDTTRRLRDGYNWFGRNPEKVLSFIPCDSRHRAAGRSGIETSAGSVGDGYDNALAETVIALYKTEVTRRDGP